LTAHADHGRGEQDDRGDRHEAPREKVFVIAMENHNWTQPASTTSPMPIFMNPQAPFINSLVSGTSGISRQVAYATNYINSGVVFTRRSPTISGPKRGTNFGVSNDDTPYHADCSPDTVQSTDQHLTAFLTKARRTWKSYREDTDVDLTSNLPLPKASWTVPLFNLSGVFAGGALNSFNYATQYTTRPNTIRWCSSLIRVAGATRRPRIRCARSPRCSNSRSTCRTTTWRLQLDYTEPVNDMHTGLQVRRPGRCPQQGDRADIAQGDNFLARIVPLDHGVKGLQGPRRDRALVGRERRRGHPDFTLPFIIISKDAQENVKGLPYASATEFSHSSTLRTMQEMFDVDPRAGYPWLGAAAAAADLSALFKPGSIR
jgi:hypothetical protein